MGSGGQWYTVDLECRAAARHFVEGRCSPFAPDPHTGIRPPGRARYATAERVEFDHIALFTLAGLAPGDDFAVLLDREPLVMQFGGDLYHVSLTDAPVPVRT